jgi:hypothetical protein
VEQREARRSRCWVRGEELKFRPVFRGEDRGREKR